LTSHSESTGRLIWDGPRDFGMMLDDEDHI
ncbi:hypothetical protein AVEN_164454-1, partial [Araneus ventricosus]